MFLFKEVFFTSFLIMTMLMVRMASMKNHNKKYLVEIDNSGEVTTKRPSVEVDRFCSRMLDGTRCKLFRCPRLPHWSLEMDSCLRPKCFRADCKPNSEVPPALQCLGEED